MQQPEALKWCSQVSDPPPAALCCCAVLQTMAQQQLSEAYKRDLLGQIQVHREATRAERQAYLEEGKRIRQEQMREKATLEAVSGNCLCDGWQHCWGMCWAPVFLEAFAWHQHCFPAAEVCAGGCCHTVQSPACHIHCHAVIGQRADQGPETARAGRVRGAGALHSRAGSHAHQERQVTAGRLAQHQQQPAWLLQHSRVYACDYHGSSVCLCKAQAIQALSYDLLMLAAG